MTNATLPLLQVKNLAIDFGSKANLTHADRYIRRNITMSISGIDGISGEPAPAQS